MCGRDCNPCRTPNSSEQHHNNFDMWTLCSMHKNECWRDAPMKKRDNLISVFLRSIDNRILNAFNEGSQYFAQVIHQTKYCNNDCNDNGKSKNLFWIAKDVQEALKQKLKFVHRHKNSVLFELKRRRAECAAGTAIPVAHLIFQKNIITIILSGAINTLGRSLIPQNRRGQIYQMLAIQ